MIADALGDGLDVGDFPEVNGDPAAVPKRAPVELEPTRLATVGQPAFGHHDIDLAAGGGEVPPRDPVARPGREQHPAARAAVDRRDATVAPAIGIVL
ncbi:MAG TPA: hypothetical protein VGR05_02435, partial [Sphingomicrobium sp.]|nr:hypothetical protein [Sphingomicrobium sp.]